MLDPLKATHEIADDYRRYLASTFSPRTPRFREEFVEALNHGITLTKGPYLQASPPFVEGASVADLVREGVLAEGFLRQHQVVAELLEQLRVVGSNSVTTRCFALSCSMRVFCFSTSPSHSERHSR
jgi:hypothetical protein